MDDLHADATRRPGDQLTAHEAAVLARLCAGTWAGSERARAQLERARWGGKEHDGEACFLVDVPVDEDVPRIPPHAGGPIATLDVAENGEPLGQLELWVEDGRLHSADYSAFTEEKNEVLPELRLIGEP